MRAFVLSGGANYGAQQVGALEVLLEHGLQPDMLMGVSAGALNAAWVALHPTREGAEELARIWREDAAAVIPSVGPLTALLRLVGGKNSLLSNQSLLQFLSRWSLAESVFGELSHPRLYTAAANYHNGSLRIFGDDPNDRILDGLMASTAMPPFYPPWEVDGVPYLDGGIISHLPAQAAVDRGATEIFALHNGQAPLTRTAPLPRNVLAIGARAISLLVDRQAQLEIEAARRDLTARRAPSAQRAPEAQLHLIDLHTADDPGLWNFAHAARLIDAGRRLAEQYLKEAGE